MNQKGIIPVILVILGVVVASAIASGVWFQIHQKQIGEKKPTGAMTMQQIDNSLAASVVKTFCDNFFKGPPALNDSGVIQALNLLSQKAHNSIANVGPSPSAALVTFVGTSDIPEQGFTIDAVSEGEQTATVKTTWKYSRGPINKVFDLVKENGEWKIDSIK
jgi:hypothetical protein